MKKEVENKKRFITDLSSSESSSDESEKEIPIENKEELEKVIEKCLLTDKKPKKLLQIKQRNSKKRESSSSNSDDQEKLVKPKKTKNSTPKLLPKKTLVKEEDLKRLRKTTSNIT